MYVQLNNAPGSIALDVNTLFNERATHLSQNPITVNCELTHMDTSLQVQTFLKTLSSFLTRITYENFGGKGIVVDEEADRKPEEEDELLKGARANINSVFIPLRRGETRAGREDGVRSESTKRCQYLRDPMS